MTRGAGFLHVSATCCIAPKIQGLDNPKRVALLEKQTKQRKEKKGCKEKIGRKDGKPRRIGGFRRGDKGMRGRDPRCSRGV